MFFCTCVPTWLIVEKASILNSEGGFLKNIGFYSWHVLLKGENWKCPGPSK